MEKAIYAFLARDYQPLHPALAGVWLVPRRDVTLMTFSLSSYLLQTAVGQCRPSLADASSAAGPGVRDRLPPWAWKIFYEKHFKISKLFYFFFSFYIKYM